MRRLSRMSRPVKSTYRGVRRDARWVTVVVLRGAAVIGSTSSTALWTVPGGRPRASVIRSMWASHRLPLAVGRNVMP